jgi:diguanylate cyclase (GGDEF)-like protein
VEPRHYPQYFGILYSAVLGIIVNIFLGFGYWYGNVPELVMLGVSGCILWPAAVYYAHRARYDIAVYCGILEIVLHIGVGVYVLGNAYGLQLILWCGIAYAAFDPVQNDKRIRNVALLCCVEFALLSAFVPEQTEVRPYEEHLDTIFIVCALSSALPMFLVLLSVKLVQNKLQNELKFKAEHDELTGLLNRGSFTAELEKNHERFLQTRLLSDPSTYSLCLADIDFFKKINDQYGHEAGDQVLIQISSLLTQSVSKEVKVCRWGGEEFAILFPSYEINSALKELQNTQLQLKNTLFSEAKLSVNLSFGVTAVTPKDSIGSVLKRADELLYKAKHEGRNRIVSGEASVENDS